MNYVALTGRLARDPELKYTQSGKAFCKFTLAVNQDYNREKADFINCTAWDKTAEIIAEYMRKGSRLGVQGRISVSSYEQDGDTKWRTEVVTDKFEFLDSKKGSQDNRSDMSVANTTSKSNASLGFSDDIDDDEFPF